MVKFAEYMKMLYLFNPENDMALANGSPYYMPPVSAKKMATDLSVLPAWYALLGSDVWVADARCAEWMQKDCPLPLGVRGVTQSDPIYNKVYPWGWSASVKHRFEEGGIASDVLPTEGEIALHRRLSGRQTAVELLPRLRGVEGTWGESFLCTSLEELHRLVACYGRMLLKAPWSGSGKGIRSITETVDASLEGWARRIIASQGAVVAEPFYQRVADFALEFRRDEEGRVSFIGYSLFETDVKGGYKGNVLASDESILDTLSAWVDRRVLHEVQCRLMEVLPGLLDGYVGFFGVDMMVCHTDGGFFIHPCVEVNLRMNMGLVAHTFFHHYVCDTAHGHYTVRHFPAAGDAFRFHQSMQRTHPLVCEDGRIRQGYMSLSPVFEDTCYVAYVVLKNRR